MPPKLPVHSFLQSPEQEDRDGDLPVTRREFREVSLAVMRIERGMFGSDRFEGTGMVAEHHEMRKKVAFATKLGWAALLGTCAAVWSVIWAKATGKVP